MKNNEERRTSFKKNNIRRKRRRRVPLLRLAREGGRRTESHCSSGVKPATSLTDGVSQFPPGTTSLPGRKRKRERERANMESVPLL